MNITAIVSLILVFAMGCYVVDVNNKHNKQLSDIDIAHRNEINTIRTFLISNKLTICTPNDSRMKRNKKVPRHIPRSVF